MEQITLGPVSKTQPYNGSILRFITDCQKYTSNLSQFKKYLVWRYTIGSAAINTRLIFGKDSDNATFWVYLFFLYYKNTVQQVNPLAKVKASDVDKKFRKYLEYFNEPRLFMVLPDFMKAKVASDVIKIYTDELQEILQKAPMVLGTGFRVFKTSSSYPGLPDPNNFEPVEVPQIPFNSTTLASDMNVAVFQAPQGVNYLWSIKIEPGTRGPLFIDSDLHAYSSFEHEVLLPHGVVFDIQNVQRVTLNVVDPANVNIKQIQSKDKISMGTVYDLNEYSPTKSGCTQIQKKELFLFDAILR